MAPEIKDKPLVQTLMALGILLVLYPDVLFLGASIQPSDLADEFRMTDHELAASILPTLERPITDGYVDLGAASWQLEPSQHFMRYCLRNLESPYWNPYVAAGTVGPESLVDSKFSIFTLLTALFGAGTLAFHGVLLAGFFFSTFFLIRTVTSVLGLSAFAGLAAGFYYLLNGFHLSYQSSQVTQPYLLAPMLLYGLLSLSRRPSLRWFSFCVAAHVFVQSATFLPTAILVLTAVYALAVADLLAARAELETPYRVLALQFASGLVGFLLLAPLWFPFLESLFVTSLVSHYSQPRFESASPWAFLSVFSPKHFWESYNAFSASVQNAGVGTLNLRPADGFVQHLGIVAISIAVHGVSKSSRRHRWLVGVATLLGALSLARIFAFPPLRWLDFVPVLGAIRAPYWGAMAAIACTVLVAFGIDRLGGRRSPLWPGGIVSVTVVAMALLIVGRVGLPRDRFLVYVAALIALAVLAATLPFLARLGRGSIRTWKIVLVCLMAAELLYYMNGFRPKRYDVKSNPPRFLELLAENRGSTRILNVGRRNLYPEWGAAFQIPQTGSMTTTQLPWYRDVYHGLIGNEWNFLSLGRDREAAAAISEPGLDLLGIRYIVVGRRMRNYVSFFDERSYGRWFEDRYRVIFENHDYLPRAFAVAELLESEELPDLSAGVRGVAWSRDPRFLESAREAGIRVSRTLGEAPRPIYPVTIRSYRHADVQIEVSAPTPAVVVLTDSWHPGWQAMVDGERRLLGRVNGAFRGIVVTPGRHLVELSYEPRSLKAALALAFLVLFALLVVGLVRAVRPVSSPE